MPRPRGQRARWPQRHRAGETRPRHPHNGGPQGAVWASADDDERVCLQAASAAAVELVAYSLEAMGDCASEACDATALAADRTSAEDAAMRAVVRMTRDWLWSELDAAGGNGYRSDEVVAFVGGFSAGAYGALYNSHWFLDDLLWPRTFAFPDRGLAVDTPSGPGVGALGAIKITA